MGYCEDRDGKMVTASSGGHGHGTCAAKNLELNGCALDAGYSQCHATVVYFVVAELLEKRVGNLSEA